MAVFSDVRETEYKQASPSPLWVWDDAAQRYRGRDGRFLRITQAVALRDQFNDRYKQRLEVVHRRLFDKRITIQQWEAEMRNNIKTVFVAQYMLGRGGRNNMTQADYGRLGFMLRRQYEFLRGFAQDIASGRYTVDSIGAVAARANMYIEASSQAFERAKTEGRGVPRLRQYPGDGNTQCKANCRCHLRIKETDKLWQVFWKLGKAEHCQDCVNLSKEWDPLEVEKLGN